MRRIGIGFLCAMAGLSIAEVLVGFTIGQIPGVTNEIIIGAVVGGALGGLTIGLFLFLLINTFRPRRHK